MIREIQTEKNAQREKKYSLTFIYLRYMALFFYLFPAIFEYESVTRDKSFITKSYLLYLSNMKSG